VPERGTLSLPRVALVMIGVGDLSGSGGAERQFADVFNYFRRTGSDRVTLITARASVARLRAAGRVRDTRGIIALPLGNAPARGVINVAWMTALLLTVTLFRRFDVVHVCLPTPSYVPYAAVLTLLPRFMRPRLALNVVDCTLAHNLETGTPADVYEQQVVTAHRQYFRWTRLDGIYTWYRAFADVCRRKHLVTDGMTVRPARYCFTDPNRFVPGKKANVIVFAGRLSEQKRPWLFIDAAACLRQQHSALAAGWRFEMYGTGVLEPRVRELIAQHRLGDVLTLTNTPDLSPVFARTRLFVSTQALENFTSLAMLEAMAAGNAVIAEDVGQTREFVGDRDNGLLVSPATADAFADAIAEYLRHPDWHDQMAEASRGRATRVHTVEHFAEDITAFWREVAGR
jgi:glycosyltransferase involved in cell wall biosynthesis